MRRCLQQQGAQIWHEVNGGNPTDQQGNDGDRKDGKGVLTRHGFGQTNGQKTSRRDQGARQHGHGCKFVGEGR